MKTHKRKKESRMHGKNMGTHGGGARKKRKGSGHKGGKGMAGTGKRADHKKTLVTKLYGHGYFGKKGVTSLGLKVDKRKRINLFSIEENLMNLIKKGLAKKTGEKYEINLKGFKILGKGEIKNKFIITCLAASKMAFDKIKKAGGEIIVEDNKKLKEKKNGITSDKNKTNA